MCQPTTDSWAAHRCPKCKTVGIDRIDPNLFDGVCYSCFYMARLRPPHCRGCDAVISVVTAKDLDGYCFACHEEIEDTERQHEDNMQYEYLPCHYCYEPGCRHCYPE